MSNNDLISREALKKQVKELLDLAVKRVDDTPTNSPCYRIYLEQANERARFVELIDNAPTVNDYPNCEYKLEADYIRSSSSYKELIDLRKFKEENTRPQGEWIKITKDGITPAEYTCSNCGRTVKSYYDDYFIVKEYPFCHCGAKMKGGTE